MSDALVDSLVPLAAQLIGTVHDEGPDAVAAVLARVPDGRHDALAVVLAAMVDPDARPSELLAWTDCGPVQSSDVELWSARDTTCPECGKATRKGNLARHLRIHRRAA